MITTHCYCYRCIKHPDKNANIKGVHLCTEEICLNPYREENKTMPPKGYKKANAKTKSKSSEGLVNALKFVSAAQRNEGTFQAHCVIADKCVTAFEGVLTIGATIEEDLAAFPHTLRFIDALERCGKELAITQLDTERLSVKSGAFSAVVPCYPGEMPTLAPDPVLAPIDDRIREGFEVIAHVSIEAAQKIVLSSILLTANSMISTNGVVMFEYWHGINLPRMILPKRFISAIMNTKKKLTGFGYSGNSATFWFDDNSWIKTQLYEEEWPNTDPILNVECQNITPLPVGFFQGISAIESFSDGKRGEKKVYFGADCLQSHRDKAEGACFEVPGVPFGPAFGIEQLKRIEHCVESIDFTSHSAAYFFGKNVRGAIMGIRV